MEKRQEALNLIKDSQKITFLTGAGVSVASGIPDYRSMTGVYAGIDAPEYLLSHSCLQEEPEKFYRFVKELYHPQAKGNIIHQTMARLEKEKATVKIVTQNIDQLHHQVGSQKVMNFHGSLYDCYCQKCGETVAVEAYLQSMTHQKCGGMIRPNVVLYEEGLAEEVISQSIKAVAEAELIVIVGTSLKVYPFASLIDYRRGDSQVIVINQEELLLNEDIIMIQEDATTFFADINERNEEK